MLRAVASLLLVLVLSGCMIGPDYKPPEVDLPDSLGDGGQTIDSGEVDTVWWSYFGDDLLTELIVEGLQANYDVKQALSRINQNRALARVAFAELLPGAELSGAYEKSRTSNVRVPFGGGGDDGADGFEVEVYSASIDALWELDIFGRLRREVESRDAEYAGAVAGLQDTLRMVAAEIASTYMQFRGSQLQLDISERNLEIQRESLDLVNTKFDLGAAEELDVARAKAQLAQTEALVPTFQALERVNAHRLAVLLGKYPHELDERLREHRSIPRYQGPVTIGTPEELLRRRPDIRVAERRLAAANARIGVAIGELFPRVSISGSLGLEAGEFSDLPDGARIFRIGPTIRWAAFDSGRLRQQVRFQEEATNEALLFYEQQVLLALEDVESALVRFSAEQRRLLSLAEAHAATQRAHELASVKYSEGELDFLDVLDTQRSMLQVETELIESKQRAAVALVGIYKSLGGGWEAFDLESIE